MSATGINRTELANCSIFVESLSEKERSVPYTVLRDNQLDKLFALLESAKVKRVGSTSVDYYSVDTVKYVLHFENLNGKVVRVDIRSDGYLFCKGFRYKIVSENEMELIGLLQKCVPPGDVSGER